jgi:hypothetical protein
MTWPARSANGLPITSRNYVSGRTQRRPAFAVPRAIGRSIGEILRIMPRVITPGWNKSRKIFPSDSAPSSRQFRSARRRAQKEREAAAKRSAAAQIDILKTQLSQAQHLYETTYQKIEAKFKEKGGADVFLEGYRKAFSILQGELSTIIPQLDKAEFAAARSAKATAAEIQKLQQEHDVRNQQLSEFGTSVYQRAQQAIKDQEKKGTEDSVLRPSRKWTGCSRSTVPGTIGGGLSRKLITLQASQ